MLSFFFFFFTKRSKTFWLRLPTCRLCITLGQLLATQIPGALWPTGSWSHTWKVHLNTRKRMRMALWDWGEKWSLVCGGGGGHFVRYITLWTASAAAWLALLCSVCPPHLWRGDSVHHFLYQNKRSSVSRLSGPLLFPPILSIRKQLLRVDKASRD